MLAWSDIEAAIGSRQGKFDVPCPACAPACKTATGRKKRVLAIWREDPDFARFHCARCGARGWTKPDYDASPRPVGGVLAQAFAAAERAERDRDQERETRLKVALAEFTYFSAGPVIGSPAEAYLAGRGLTPGEDLRFSTLAPRRYDDEGGVPGMVAAIRNVHGELTGAQVTHLDPQGRKIKRLTFGKIAGGAVRLAQIAQDGVLGVAEGVETALAFQALYGVPTWAALSATGIEQFDIPPGVSRLVIAADKDDNSRGLEAAQRLAHRARQVCAVAISMPPPGDWADELLRRGRAAA